MTTRFCNPSCQALSLSPSRCASSARKRGILFRIHLAKSDMPLVIGKAGQSIKALRLLMKMHAKDGPAVSLKLRSLIDERYEPRLPYPGMRLCLRRRFHARGPYGEYVWCPSPSASDGRTK